MNRARLTMAVTAGVVVVAACVVAVGARLSSDTARTCDIPEPTTASAVSASVGGIHVIEQGFSQSSVDGSVSLGAVLENTSRMVAYRTRIVLDMFDATHRSLIDGHPIVQEIPVLLPGQRIGFGGTAQPINGRKAATVQIDVSTTHWLRPADVGSFAPVTATDLRTLHPDPGSPSIADIHYTESSANCRSLVERGAATVFRNSQGVIVGGALTQPGGLTVFRDQRGLVVGGERHLPSGDPCSPGTRDMWVIPSSPTPTTAVMSRTTVYPYCDLALPNNGDEPGRPEN